MKRQEAPSYGVSGGDGLKPGEQTADRIDQIERRSAPKSKFEKMEIKDNAELRLAMMKYVRPARNRLRHEVRVAACLADNTQRSDRAALILNDVPVNSRNKQTARIMRKSNAGNCLVHCFYGSRFELRALRLLIARVNRRVYGSRAACDRVQYIPF
uniref:Uncharacterized protein n=1 Tax=Plectus sambesii TaxID=2011161 RepID=A0A914W4H9_9BILA